MTCEHKYYSIILKGCSRREKLSSRLETVLLRGKTAIKMALDQMPSVIIYKGNVNNIISVLQAFTAEKAAITVVTGDIPHPLALYKIYPKFLELSAELQLLLVDVPQKLWLGETIHTIAPAKYLNEDGALVISSHAVYFIDRPDGDKECRSLIIPYSQMTDLPAAIPSQENTLAINYLDLNGYQTDLFTMSTDWLTVSQAAISQAQAAKEYLIKIKTSCIACDSISEAYTDSSPHGDRCRCGQLYERTIIK